MSSTIEQFKVPSVQEAERMIAEYEEMIERLREYVDAAKALSKVKGFGSSASDYGNGVRSGTSNATLTPPSGLTTGLRPAIRDLFPKLPLPFSANDVLEALGQKDFTFPGEPKRAVRSALAALCDTGEITMYEEGKGGSPNLYKLPKK